MDFKEHELSKIIPSMSEEEYQGFKEDIRINGLNHPIILYEGKVLDGRHRYRACQELKIEIRTEEYKGDQPLTYIISQNIKRRHLTQSQIAAIAVELLPKLEEEAKKRQATSTGGKEPKLKQHVTKVSQAERGRSREHVSKLFGVGASYISDAKRIKEEKPEIFKEIKEGKTTISEAKHSIKKEAREAKRDEDRKVIKEIPNIKDILGKVKFPTITVDPPWDWGDEEDIDQKGRAKPDYATMPFDEILNFPVGDFADKDCHIYLWITNRSLPKGFALLEKWGFRYITCITWCKPSFGMGNYFRGATEHILFGVKGSQELKRKNASTWFEAPRGKGGHSSKPEEFYKLVESCSPGPYLEIFARSEEKRSDWTQWGSNIENV